MTLTSFWPIIYAVLLSYVVVVGQPCSVSHLERRHFVYGCDIRHIVRHVVHHIVRHIVRHVDFYSIIISPPFEIKFHEIYKMTFYLLTVSKYFLLLLYALPNFA